jgi:hypothetical protein
MLMVTSFVERNYHLRTQYPVHNNVLRGNITPHATEDMTVSVAWEAKEIIKMKNEQKKLGETE